MDVSVVGHAATYLLVELLVGLTAPAVEDVIPDIDLITQVIIAHNLDLTLLFNYM